MFSVNTEHRLMRDTNCAVVRAALAAWSNVVCEEPTEVHLHTWGAVQDGPHPLLAHEYATTELFHAPPMITRSQDRPVGLTWGLPRGLLAPAAPPQLFSERHSALAQVIGDVVSCPAVMYVAPT
jgi:hypothetical protein